MISTDQLAQALERQLAGTPVFVVTAEVRPNGKATVEVDNASHIGLEELASINRGLRDTFGPALDDVELEVGSPGMGRPFKVPAQYHKNIGRLVEVKLNDGRTITGELASVNDRSVELRVLRPSKVKGRAPKLDEQRTAFAFADIHATRTPITF